MEWVVVVAVATVLLNIASYTGNALIEMKGGKGADVSGPYSSSSRIGAGGGGGGGLFGLQVEACQEI